MKQFVRWFVLLVATSLLRCTPAEAGENDNLSPSLLHLPSHAKQALGLTNLTTIRRESVCYSLADMPEPCLKLCDETFIGKMMPIEDTFRYNKVVFTPGFPRWPYVGATFTSEHYLEGNVFGYGQDTLRYGWEIPTERFKHVVVALQFQSRYPGWFNASSVPQEYSVGFSVTIIPHRQ